MEKSNIEKVSSSFVTKGAATGIAVVGTAVTPLAAFLPFLVEAIASGRQAERLEAMFSELSDLLDQNSENIKNMSDDQYKVINESISAALYTINEEKLQLIKRSIVNALHDADAVSGVSDALSRLVRDISTAEAAFLIENFSYDMVEIAKESSWGANVLAIEPNSDNEIILSGLINLGLLYSKQARVDVVAYEWSPLAVKFIRLIKNA